MLPSRLLYLLLLAFACLLSNSAAETMAAAPNAFILNEANAISGERFIDKGRGDPYFSSPASSVGRVQGHGQNWFEFLVVQGDELPGGGFSKGLDLRGWTLEWSYDKNDPLDPNQFGQGTIQFTNDPLWQAVPVGTLLTVTEWKDAWYLNDSPFEIDPWGAGGLERVGGTNGLGTPRGDAYDSNLHTYLDFSTDTSWDPAADDWHMHVYAGERNADTSFKYFNFTGSITTGDETHDVVTDEAGLFALNNDNWQWTIKDAQGQVVQGPLGEEGTNLPGSSWRLSAEEIIKLEAFNVGTGATADSYLGVGVADYRDGSTSSFGGPNSWSSGGGLQDLTMLRNWSPLVGDVNLDGTVDGDDYVAWKNGFGITEGAILTQGDLNGDGAVNLADYTIWRDNLGATNLTAGALASTTAIPEPSAILLGSVMFVASIGIRKWNRLA
ncbi:dockerin type I repeat-containing protein [Aeoliella sp. SH292]|uniref:dockerin type I repeat-containing protein n=1 Tax=Aeoliella sp. SH292 TaxID=3454464 RepID=UPI003F95AD82